MTLPLILIAPASRGLSLALVRHYLKHTQFAVYATHRSDSADTVRARILQDLPDIEQSRLTLLKLELTSEESIASAAEALATSLPSKDAYIHTAFFTGGVLHPERRPADLDARALLETFQVNVIAHLLLIKHFSRFLPTGTQLSHARSDTAVHKLAKWVHVSARVGSISDNRLGGWYSYRASKAALNQIVRTFDLHLQAKGSPAMCVGVHPGTVKTDLSRDFWAGVPKERLFEPEYAASRLVEVVEGLHEKQRGKVWDWAGREVVP
jgi:NAD(P)-dependent dehydrogenase (short-subunit alcohol dehydrogenase family)